jgi:hypothetical protein
VPTTLLNAGKFKKFLYETTPRKRKIQIRVESNLPIDVFIVQASDIQSWKNSDDYGGMSFLSRKLIEAEVNMPKDFEQEWYLIIENHGAKPAAVHYELFDV